MSSPNPTTASGILPKCRRGASVAREGEETKVLEAASKEDAVTSSTFVCSLDGMLGREAKTFDKRLKSKLASKCCEKSYSEQVCGYAIARLSTKAHRTHETAEEIC